ncbi:complexin-3-like [Entelurus aequoreus]|uniref:complexin-3-like n=1 Tax=Entelurus aequoreus TaxID=161455 RepID=UPI002B1DC8BA|nr:complexin-3-like [Entelurus aequoreus]
MESLGRVKKSLRTPVRKLTGCLGGLRDRKLCGGNKRRRRGGGRGRGGGPSRSAKKPPFGKTDTRRPSRSYQADLDKQRRLGEDKNAKKNSERAAMRAHFRRKYHLSEDAKDSDHLRRVGGRVPLPRQLSELVCPANKTKDEDFSLLDAFQGLSLAKGSKSAPPTPARGRACQVM